MNGDHFSKHNVNKHNERGFQFHVCSYVHAPNYEDHKNPHHGHGDAKDQTKHFGCSYVNRVNGIE